MRYKYKRNQIFGKRLKLSRLVLEDIYDCRLSFTDYIFYGLDKKIPISCIKEEDREIVEKFGIDKCKEIDYRLDNGKQDNYDVKHQIVRNFVVQQMEEVMKSSVNRKK